ncbi:hypothetical protein Tco_0668808 [Tanacetum coccineum]
MPMKTLDVTLLLQTWFADEELCYTENHWVVSVLRAKYYVSMIFPLHYDYPCSLTAATLGHRYPGHQPLNKSILIMVKMAFEKHLEEIHTLWTQFGKKRDKIATSLEDTQDLAYSSWRRRHKSLRRRQDHKETASEILATASE